MDTVLVVLRIGLAVVFATAAAGKLLDREGSKQALADFGVGRRLVGPGAVLLPLAELAVAVALLPAASAAPAAAGALALLAAFSAGIGRAIAHGEAPDCHCFGQLHSEPAGPKALIRNAVLAAPAAVVLFAGPGQEIATWAQQRAPYELVAFLVAAAGAAGLAIWARRRAAAKARREAARPTGLPVGAPAPTFTLSGLESGRVSLDDLSRAGRPVLLVFTHPRCGPCQSLLPDLERWQRSLAEEVTIALVSQGGEADNREAHEEHVLSNVLLEEGTGAEVYDAYRLHGTPSAVAVGPDRRIATVTAMGDIQIEQLVRVVLGRFGPAAGDLRRSDAPVRVRQVPDPAQA